jgi:ribonuclease R
MGKYRRLLEDDVVEAKLRCSSKGFCFAIQDVEDSDDIYIRENHLSNAWNGDRVLVKIIREASRRRSPEGEVKVILERSNNSLLAIVKKTETGYRAVPLDDRLLFEIELLDDEEELAKAENFLVHVNVIRHPLAQHLTLGKVSKILGSDAEEAADTDIVCCKHDLKAEFSPELEEEASKLKALKMTKKLLANRLDLRSLRTFTIAEEPFSEDSSGMWQEQALTLEPQEGGTWQLGIHLADFTSYVPGDSPLDLEAKARGSAIYLGSLTIPLFPANVMDLACFEVKKDKLAISLLLNLDGEGHLTSFELQPSVIKVDHALTLSQIQNILNGEAKSPNKELTAKLEQLFLTLSPQLKSQRLQRGSFDIVTPTFNHLFVDDGRLGVVFQDQSLPVRALLKEVMILGGKAIGEHFKALDLPGIYCLQAEPETEELGDLIRLANNLSLDTSIDLEEEVIPQHYQHLTEEFNSNNNRGILHHLLRSTLKPIRYASHPGKHFGLAFEDSYMQCLSPGQRYGDLFIQRVISLLFEQGRDRRHSNVKQGVNIRSSECHGEIKWIVLPPTIHNQLQEELINLSLHLNEQEKIAADAEKDLLGLKKSEKMKACTGQVFQGLITGVQSYGFFVQIEEFLVEGLVHVSSLKDDWYEYRSRQACLVGRKSRTSYRLGDQVDVEVKNVDYYRQQIDLGAVKELEEGEEPEENNENTTEDQEET